MEGGKVTKNLRDFHLEGGGSHDGVLSRGGVQSDLGVPFRLHAGNRLWGWE